MRRRVFAASLLALLALAAGCGGLATPARPQENPAMRADFDAKLVKRGAGLAALGGCASCHTRQGGRPYAGGVALQTSFGVVYGTNITPERGTGIGTWSEAAFKRAMREGIAQDGRHLYPVFPYEHFKLLTDDDLDALYAFLMTRDPVRAAAPKNKLRFPYSIRPLVAVWNELFLRRAAPFAPDASKSEQWNRGAYLAQGLAHCGACHTPLNRFGAEKKGKLFDGGEAEGWTAPALDAASPSPLPWTQEDLAAYLRTGLVPRHAIAGGPMQEVVHGLGQAPEADVRAIATYVYSILGGPNTERQARAKSAKELAAQLSGNASAGAGTARGDGASLYAGACGGCHDRGRALSSGGALELPLAVAVREPDPKSLLRIILEGIVPPEGESGRWMPSFRGAFTEAQLASLVAYLRTLAPGEPPWKNIPQEVKKAQTP